MGAYDQAMEHYQQALKLLRELNHSYLEAGTLDRLAQIHLAMGQLHEARARWEEALDLYRAQLRTTDIDRVERLLSQVR
jgi:tetratricopeptide (TPR) repeat protein